MNILEISITAISASAPSVIISCIIAGALFSIVFIFKDALKNINNKHNIVRKDDNVVEPTSWNNGEDGIDASGFPYFGVVKDTVDVKITASAGTRISDDSRDERTGIKDVA